jgi:CRP/FNR family transcriptional regulator
VLFLGVHEPWFVSEIPAPGPGTRSNLSGEEMKDDACGIRPGAPLYPLHRPEIYDRLRRADVLIDESMLDGLATFRRRQRVVGIEGERSTIYRLLTGWVARTRPMSDGRRQILSIRLPGDLIGLRRLLVTKPATAIECLTPVTLARIERSRMEKLIEDSPDVALRVMFQLAEDERRLHNWVVALGRGAAEERIAVMLIDLDFRLNHLGLSRENTFAFPLSQQQIADHLGLTQVHVNRTLRDLRERGIATIMDGTATLYDLPALRALAEPFLDLLDPHP